MYANWNRLYKDLWLKTPLELFLHLTVYICYFTISLLYVHHSGQRHKIQKCYRMVNWEGMPLPDSGQSYCIPTNLLRQLYRLNLPVMMNSAVSDRQVSGTARAIPSTCTSRSHRVTYWWELKGMATVNISRGFREAKQPLPFLAVYSVLFIHNYIVDSGPILSWILNEVGALWCPDLWGNFQMLMVQPSSPN